MLYVLFAIIIVLAVVFAVMMFRRAKAATRKYEQLRAVVDKQDDYAFLVNRDFEVQQTNFPVQQRLRQDEPRVLGNVLHCRNAEDAGRCGEHVQCGKCPVRFTINKAFERREDFSHLEACMELYDAKERVVDVDVQVGGRYVSLEDKDHMVVNVRPVESGATEALPKVLFISENVVLFDRVRTSLGKKVRVLSADNLHQALHRLLMASSYHFLAVMIDEAFYSSNYEITKLLVENDGIKVIVFTSKDHQAAAGPVHFLSEDFEPQELCMLLLHKGAASA